MPPVAIAAGGFLLRPRRALAGLLDDAENVRERHERRAALLSLVAEPDEFEGALGFQLVILRAGEVEIWIAPSG
jgi:hypothetical protein